jgi:hypothetical protein
VHGRGNSIRHDGRGQSGGVSHPELIKRGIRQKRRNCIACLMQWSARLKNVPRAFARSKQHSTSRSNSREAMSGHLIA